MKLITYTVKPEPAGENEALIRAVLAEAQGFGYRVFVAGETFFHLAEETDGLTELPVFQAFLADHASRRIAAPVTYELREIGSAGGVVAGASAS